MSVLQHDPKTSTAPVEPTGGSGPTAPTRLITEQEVLMPSAVAAHRAAPVLPAPSRLGDRIARWHLLRNRRPRRRRYPTRYTFLEPAAMAREMHRL